MDLDLGTDLDLTWTDGDLVLVDGVEARGQELHIRWSRLLGEWYENVDAGIPLFEEVAVKGLSAARAAAPYQVEGARVVGFVRYDSFDPVLDRATRQLSLAGRVVFIEGTFDFSLIVEV